MIRQMIIPREAAQAAEIRLFWPEPRMDLRVRMVCQYLKVMFPVSKMDLPIFMVKEVMNTVAKGMATTTMANRLTTTVMGIRHFPRSTMLGRVDLPDTVMYSRLPTTKLDT